MGGQQPTRVSTWALVTTYGEQNDQAGQEYFEWDQDRAGEIRSEKSEYLTSLSNVQRSDRKALTVSPMKND